MIENWKDLFTPAREVLAALPIVGDLGPYAALTLAVWVLIWGVRRYRPTWWAWLLRLGPDPEGALTHFAQAVPAAVIGALWAGGTTLELEQAAYGLLAGLAAPLWHHALKALPVPYQGVLQDRAVVFSRALRNSGVALLLLCCLGCTKADMLKVVKTADDAARAACSIFFSEHQGINVVDAAKLYCDTREKLAPFLASQQQAGEELAASQGLSRK